MRLGHGQVNRAVLGRDRADSCQRPERVRLRHGVRGELDHVFPTETGNQLARRAERDHPPMVDDRHPITKPFRLV